MTRAEIKTSLQAIAGYETDTDTQQNAAINAAYREVVGEHHWAWLETTTTLPLALGLLFVSLSTITDLLHLRSVRLTDPTSTPINLQYRTPEEMRELHFTDNTSRSTPLYWSNYESKITFWPAADKAYTVSIAYIKDPPDLSLDADIPLIPLTYHDILAWGGAKYMAARERDWTAFDRWNLEFEGKMRRMKAQLGLKQQQTSQQIGRSGMYDDGPVWRP